MSSPEPPQRVSWVLGPQLRGCRLPALEQPRHVAPAGAGGARGHPWRGPWRVGQREHPLRSGRAPGRAVCAPHPPQRRGAAQVSSRSPPSCSAQAAWAHPLSLISHARGAERKHPCSVHRSLPEPTHVTPLGPCRVEDPWPRVRTYKVRACFITVQGQLQVGSAARHFRSRITFALAPNPRHRLPLTLSAPAYSNRSRRGYPAPQPVQVGHKAFAVVSHLLPSLSTRPGYALPHQETHCTSLGRTFARHRPPWRQVHALCKHLRPRDGAVPGGPPCGWCSWVAPSGWHHRWGARWISMGCQAGGRRPRGCA